jgi:Xaa-Pro aminopeptidase
MPSAAKTSATSTKPPVIDPHPGRLARLRSAVAAAGHDHFLVTNPLDVAYLTGFDGGDSYLFLSARSAVVLSDFRYQEELEPVRRLATILIRTGSMKEGLVQVFGERSVTSCAIQAETMTIAERDGLAKALGRTRKLIPTTGIVAAMRTIKDESEVDLIRKAVRIQEQALLAVLPTIKPGVSEIEIAAGLEAEMKSRGSSQPGFQTIVAAQPNGSLPHYRAGKAKVAKNKTVLIDWGAVFRGYHGDMTRVFALGTWPKEIREIYQITLDAQEMAAAALAPGRTTREIDAVARDHITKHGYGREFGHGLGHGLGFNGHEDPRLSHMVEPTELRVGQVVTIEPGIYLPGIGGVRIEDDYVITEKGAKNLCSLPKDLAWATL